MFSTLQKQKRAESLIEEARHIIEETDEKCALARERLEKRVAVADNFRNRLARKILKRFHDLFFKIEGAPAVEMADIPERPFAAQLHDLTERIDEIETPEISAAKKGKLKAVAASVAAAFITVLAALAAAFVATGTPPDQQIFTDPSTIEKLLLWIGGGALGYPDASPLLGGGGLAVAALAAALITWSILMSKSSGRNLMEAESSHADAENYRDRKEHFISSMERLDSEISELGDILETFDVFLQEYNAVIRRILYTEGAEFENYKESSRKLLSRAAVCAEALVPILNITVVTMEGTPSEQLSEALERGRAFRKALIEDGELPNEAAIRKESAEKKEEPTPADREVEKPSLSVEDSLGEVK
ncbi:hypothetical protein NNO_1870 [Hydrogenimonas sp.]|nr:hypothetical protein NNO_1870 [Hydrogenimonas sp.]